MKTWVLIIWLMPSLYFCLGGISNIIISKNFENARLLPEDSRIGADGNSYRNKAEQDASSDYESMMKYYPIYKLLGTTLSYLLFLMSFGILGSVLRVLVNKISASPLPSESILPIVGLIIGLAVIIIDEFLPEFKYQSGKEKFYFSFSLLGGVYSKEFLEIVAKKFIARLNKD